MYKPKKEIDTEVKARKYYGNKKTGQIYCVKDLLEIRMDQIRAEKIEPITCSYGNKKCILSRFNSLTGEYEFKEMHKREWRLVQILIDSGWTLRKDYNSLTVRG